MIKIDIISGFLGAGKTTLIKKILDEKPAGQVICVIENEFGDIGIDGGQLLESGVEVMEIYSGCICCTLIGNFERALEELIVKYRPERIIIEPTGIAKLSDVLRACEEALQKEDVQLGMCLVVVNAVNYDMYMKNWPEFFINQIEQAKTIVMSRSQNASPDTLEKTTRDIKRINPDANMITTPWDRLDAQTIIRAAERDASLSLENEVKREAECCTCGHIHHPGEEHHHHEGHECHEHHHGEHDHDDHECHEYHHGEHDHDHSADEVFQVWGIETPRSFAKEDIQKALETLSESRLGKVLRAKGIVQLEGGGWIKFDFVPGEIGFVDWKPDYTGRICVIGEDLDKNAIAELFGVA